MVLHHKQEGGRDRENYLTNEELVKLYHDGDPSALEALYLQNHRLIRYTVRRLCRGREQDFDDEMQEAFFMMIKKVNKFREEGSASLATYIVKQIIWGYKDRRRTAQSQHEKGMISLDTPINRNDGNTILLIDTLPDPTANFEDEISDEMVRNQLKVVLHEIISTLPERQRAVIQARLEGYSQLEQPATMALILISTPRA